MRDVLQRIDAVSALGIVLVSLTAEEAVVAIPVEGNRNDKNTFFAGSLYSAMVLAGWCLTMKLCAGLQGSWEAVIKDCRISFTRPAGSDCRAVARLERAPEERGEGRLAVFVTVEAIDARNRRCALFHGEYRGFRR
ncbi:MAG: DUF4442 domain-containing protein [Desulfuromonadaceae bacterium]|nr:DUF4442 domain-containing protein [Desulfuromonadaceae bacterium]